jgi:hypothetical protein
MAEGITFAQGKHVTNAAEATREVGQSVDVAAYAAKHSTMTPEGIQMASKFGTGPATAAGIDLNRQFATYMTLSRSNVSGDESGTFMRQVAAVLLAPTQKARAGFESMGLRYEDYATQGNVSAEAIESGLRRQYGHGMSAAAKADYNKRIEENPEIVSNRETLVTTVIEAMKAAGETLTRTDEKHVAKTVGTQYDVARQGLRGADMWDYIVKNATASQLIAILGAKQGGRGSLLLNNRDQYFHQREGLENDAPGYAAKIAGERTEGLAAAVDRLTAAMDTASKQVVKANEGWLTPAADMAGKVASVVANLDESSRQAVSIAAGLGGVAAVFKAGQVGVSVISSLSSLAVNANAAAVALARIPAGSVPGVPGAPATGPKSSSLAKGMGVASSVLGWAAVAAVVLPPAWDYAGKVAAGNDDTKGGGAANYRRRLARLQARQNEFEDLVTAQAGPFDKYQPDTWQTQRGATRDFLRHLSGEETGGGWQESARTNVKQVDGASKWGDGTPTRDITIATPRDSNVTVTGTVEGSAELHQSLTIDVQPSAYFVSLVKQAEALVHIGISGRLGEGMRGPGDNSIMPSLPPPVGTQ